MTQSEALMTQEAALPEIAAEDALRADLYDFLAAILAGYLMYSVYPHIVDDIPKWFTLPVAVAFSAHVGGRLFQEMENELVNRYTNLFDRRR